MIIKKLSQISELLSVFSDNENLKLYGAGRVTNALLACVFSHDIENLDRIDRIVVSDKTNNPENIMGIKVCSLDDVSVGKMDTVIVSTFEQYQQDIVDHLNKYSVGKVFLINDALYRDILKSLKCFEVDVISTLQTVNNELKNTKKIIQKLLTEKVDLRNRLIKIENAEREVFWATNFNNMIKESEWCIKRDFAPTGMAVGFYYLYILYKALDSGKFDSFLDIGLGQTTKMFSQYSKYIKKNSLTVIESDEEWACFFEKNIDMSYTDILILPCKMERKEDDEVRVYEGFDEKLKDKLFDIISIDGPYGGDMHNMSRLDILSILPDCLKKSWIILVDDLSRIGEKNTFQKILALLDASNIKYTYAIHHGSNSFGVITSLDNRFFCKI